MAANFLEQVRADGTRFWQGLGRSQRILLGAVSLAIAVAVIGVVMWSQNPNWTPLFTKMETRDASDVVARLRESSTPYKLADNGSTVLVPADQVHELRLTMAAEGLPHQGKIGFELFDKTNFGMTDFTQKLNYQRALQGELERTIGGVAGVDQARVHLVIPEPDLFSDQEKEATAAITLKLGPSTRLEDSQIRSISHLVAASVEGLKEDNISIIDTSGNLLFDREILADLKERPQKDPTMDGKQMEMQKQVEERVAKSVQGMLDRVVGPGNAVVRVSVALDFNTEQSESEIFTPNGGDQDQKVVRSQKTLTESGEGAPQPGPAGVPGINSNIPSYQAQADPARGVFDKAENVTNYEVSKRVTKETKALGQVRRLSVSAAVNGTFTDEQINNMKQMVAAAAGIEVGRGDTVVVTGMPFDNSFAEKQVQQMQESQRQQFFLALGGIALAVVALVALFVALFLAFGKRRKVDHVLDEDLLAQLRLPEEQAPPFAALPEESEEEDDREAYEEEEYEVPVLQLSAEAQKRQATIEGLSNMAKDDPAAMAKLLRAWMTD